MKDFEKHIQQDRLKYLESLDAEGLLRELLAVVHRDGGHNAEKVGLAQSVLDAESKISEGKTK